MSRFPLASPTLRRQLGQGATTTCYSTIPAPTCATSFNELFQVRLEVIRPLQNLHVLAIDRLSIGPQLTHVRCVNFLETGIQVYPVLQCHAVDNVSHISQRISYAN